MVVGATARIRLVTFTRHSDGRYYDDQDPNNGASAIAAAIDYLKWAYSVGDIQAANQAWAFLFKANSSVLDFASFGGVLVDQDNSNNDSGVLDRLAFVNDEFGFLAGVATNMGGSTLAEFGEGLGLGAIIVTVTLDVAKTLNEPTPENFGLFGLDTGVGVTTAVLTFPENVAIGGSYVALRHVNDGMTEEQIAATNQAWAGYGLGQF